MDYAKLLSQGPQVNKDNFNKSKDINLRIKGIPLAIFLRNGILWAKIFSQQILFNPSPGYRINDDILKKESFKEEIKTLLDLGSGSGVIGITAKLEIPSIDKLVLTDISKRCLMIIKKIFHSQPEC